MMFINLPNSGNQKMMSPDEKRRIRAQYEVEGKSLYWLSAQYSVPYSTLWGTAKREKWSCGRTDTPEPPSSQLEARLKSILRQLLDSLDADLNRHAESEKITTASQTRIDTAFKTYLKLVEIQAKLDKDPQPANNKKGHSNSPPTADRRERNALVKSLLRRLDVLRISGETEIRNILAEHQ